MYTFLTSSDLFIFCLILLSRKSSAADYWHEECQPKNCGNGLNITFPFYIQGVQESYCGYPGFELNCTKGHGYPTIRLPGNDYIVENISYSSRSFRVYNSAVLNTSNRTCLPQIRNTTLPTAFNYANVTLLYLLSNCTKPLPDDLSRYQVSCGSENRDDWDLAIRDKDENSQNGLENCKKHVVAPVDAHGDDHENGMGNYMKIIRRGFVLNWTASDCSKCQESGGVCGFNTSVYQFKCFCPDRPHSVSCMPVPSGLWYINEHAELGSDLFFCFCFDLDPLQRHGEDTQRISPPPHVVEGAIIPAMEGKTLSFCNFLEIPLEIFDSPLTNNPYSSKE
ncbi:LEAF RUST 10 DISEASE-RESISTANCE LOCUS RECEPTOR-LIKE PROTEIN KINASE-like 1.2 [Olea europaea var. sylvestris]|uniref:LEAF RUST 10 DISEASE-RESISTANCE LOCUS RECEPTOR-LIKE PROTEIN KINASE-like 1.2 n=1 Tax=Olea europaea var. sylvestris TaxID=158386 RepID=UPI000C1D87A9|nr:LEAF RUST 10 DISEASE-RESISTANCE LOCUS RECEPTOR-LIKE PROTEIN KINASE-like 1.2 [Olea europaea var. sylvestris]